MRQAYLQLHLSIFIFGFTGILGALINLPETTLVWYRLGISTLGFYIALKCKPEWFGFKTFAKLCGIGILLALHWLTFFGAIKLSSASVTLVCLSVSTLFTALLEPIFQKRRLSKLEIALGIFIVLGIYLMSSFQTNYSLGILVGLISAGLAALYSVLNKRIINNFDSTTLNFYEIGGGWLFLSLLFPFYLAFAPTQTLIPSNVDWFYILVLSFICTNFAYNLSLQALRKISAFNYVLAVNLEPVYGIILAYFILDELREINIGFVIGVLIVLSSVATYPIIKFLQKIPTSK